MTGTIIYTDLTTLLSRIDAEVLALKGMQDAATNINIIAKVNQLGLLSADIQGLLEKLRTGELNQNNFTVRGEDLRAFFQSLGRPSAAPGAYPDLFNTAGRPSSSSTTNVGTVGGTNGITTSGRVSVGNQLPKGGMPFDPQAMFQGVQDVKWRYEMSFDPALSQKNDLLDRLESLEKRIMSYAQSGKPIPDDVKKVLTHELDVLTAIIKNTKLPQDNAATSTATYKERPASEHTRTASTAATTYRQDDRVYTNPPVKAGAGYSLFAGVPQDSEDVRVRPGFVLNDDQIRHRASSAAFNTQAVGGMDYKERAAALCRQIKNAGIGSPTDFGCITNPTEVSANYSWRGNYAMVCNRLGDTWGSWYPEMFGCPKYDPDDQYNGNLL